MIDSPENSTSNEDLLQKTLRKLNSCITLKSVAPAPASRSESVSSSEGSREASRSPELHSESEEDENKLNSNVVKDWSNKCISISFAKRDGKSEEKTSGNEGPITAKESPKLPIPEDSSAKANVNSFKCSFCQARFKTQSEIVRHIPTCQKLGGSVSFTSGSSAKNISESEEESSEEESETARSIAALKLKVAKPAVHPGDKTTQSISTNLLSSIANLPKGISISTSCTIKQTTDSKTEQVQRAKPETDSNTKQVQRAKPETGSDTEQVQRAKPETDSKTEQVQRAKPETDSKTEQVQRAKSETDSKTVQVQRAKQETENKRLKISAADFEDFYYFEDESTGEESSGEDWADKATNKRHSKAKPKTSTLVVSKQKASLTESNQSKNSSGQGDTTGVKKVSLLRKDSFEFIGFSKYTKEKRSEPPVDKKYKNTGRKSTAKLFQPSPLPCVPCNIEDIGSLSEFNSHHLRHIKKVAVALEHLSSEYTNTDEENSKDEQIQSPTEPCSDSNTSIAGDNPISPSSNKSESGSLKLTFKISEVEDPGGNKKIKTISILNTEGMQESHDKQIDIPPTESSSILFQESSDAPNITTGPTENSLPTPNQFPADPTTTFSNAVHVEAPNSYEPQFESYTGDWLNEYESGERIAAAMTGAAPLPNNRNNILPAGSIDEGLYNGNQPLSTPAHANNQQGGFEQLCLNDSYNQNQANATIAGQQSQHLPYNNDMFSDVNYMNNADRQVNSIGQRSESQYNGSNPSTPNSVTSHPSPGDSFRSLAASPQNMTSPMMSDTISPTPPFSGHGPSLEKGMPNAPCDQNTPLSISQDTTMEVTSPRLTIANNLMPTTTASSLTPLIPVHNQQQWAQSSSPQSFAQSYIQNAMGPPGTIRPSIPGIPGDIPVGYRPSPRPRVRGRPPIMDGLNRSMMRGPGRPPGPNSVNGSRGGTMHRGSNHMYGSGSRMTPPQKRQFTGSPNQSPSKNMRREDINVPSRQKDTDCQIIAVANRNEGMPVISNVQGNSQEDRARPLPTSSEDSTIHLSDSITLSVRPNTSPAKASKGGDAGVVANLLASRGITVTPAAGEKDAAVGSREERRLPSASDLNLSSAISVHPPSRDRDGFAVPQPPQNRSSVNDTVERPSRPPTVDLTLDTTPLRPPTARLQCSQCSKTFPTPSLLADHAKVHQSQQQSRMPYKCHLCNAGFSAQKGQQTHYQQFHQLHLSASDLAIPIVDVRNPMTQRKMQQLGVRAFLPLTNLQNRGSGGVVGIPILTLENINNGQMSLQQWGITDVMSLGPPKTFNAAHRPSLPNQMSSPTNHMSPRMPRPAPQ